MRNGKDHKGLVDLILSLNKDDLTIVEIGVSEGHGTETILSTHKVKKIFSIDPWSNINPAGTDPCTTNNYKILESRFDSICKNHSEIVKIKGTIDAFIEQFPNEKVDLVYIDGSHEYKDVCHDIDVALNIIKPRLAVSGHDFADSPSYILGVKKAVLEKIGMPDRTFEDTSWIKYLK